MSLPLFIFVPTQTMPTSKKNSEVPHDDTDPMEWSCASSISSQSSVCTFSDRWLSSSSKDTAHGVTVAAAPRFPRRLCSDLSVDSAERDEVATPPQLRERKNFGAASTSHQDFRPKLPRRSWTLPMIPVAGERKTNICGCHEQHSCEKPEKHSPTSEEMETPIAMAA